MPANPTSDRRKTGNRRATTGNRRRNLGLAAIALTIGLLALLLAFLDDDPKPIPTVVTPEQARAATALRETIVNDINVPDTPDHPTTEALVTPPGKDWWTLAVSVAHDTQLFNAPTPKNATWYAVTTSKAYKPSEPTHAVAHALHIAFKSRDAAHDYLDAIAATRQTFATAIARGSIITLAPNWIDPYAQPYPKPSKALDAAAATTTPVATWHHDLGRERQLLLAENPDKKTRTALTEVYGHLGFTDTTTWDLAATNPAGPWTGTLTGYHADRLDITAARDAIADTVITQCQGSGTGANTCTATEPLNPFTAAAAWYQPSAATTPIDPNPHDNIPAPAVPTTIPAIVDDNRNYLPETTATDALLTFGIHLVAEKGALTGTGYNYAPPIPIIKGTITPATDDTAALTLTTPTGKALRDWELLDKDDPYWKGRGDEHKPMDTQTGTAKPNPTGAPKTPETDPEDDTPGYSIDQNGNVVPDKPIKTPDGMGNAPHPTPVPEPTNVPKPPVATPTLTNPGTAIPDIAVMPEESADE